MSKCVRNDRTFWIFLTTKISMQQGSLKNDISFESSRTKVELWTEIFMDQIKPVVTEKPEFEKRHLSSF